MRISLFTNYGSLNSKPIFESLSIGLTKLGHNVLYNEINADVFVIWSILFAGRMSPNKQIWEYAKKNNIPIVVLEVGGLKRDLRSWELIYLNGNVQENIF
jgi:hypothetical protein